MESVINLHTNTEYSLLESTIKIDDLIAFAKKNKLHSLTITDHNVMYGVAEFVAKCQKANIKPIVGLDLDVEDFRLILLAKNYKGYQDLMNLSSDKISGKDIKLTDIPVSNLFIIDHPVHGSFHTKKRLLHLHNYFVGITQGEMPKGVAVQDIRIVKESGNKALSILNFIKDGKEKKTFNKVPLNINYKNQSLSMVQQANLIASECNIKFPHVKSSLPDFDTPDSLLDSSYLKQIIKKNVDIKLTKVQNREVYLKRIKYEIDVIERLGFSNYFLIIWDLIQWSKKQNISVGPGRGSSAGSIVAYLLGITDIDPIEFGLMFERFLNPERVTMPDIDIDIQDDKRDEVVKYIFNKYGEKNTALIITFSKLGAKMSLRDTARFLGIPPREIDTLSKMIKFEMTLEENYNKVAVFKAKVESHPKFKELFESAKLIEGLPKNHGTHAAGIVISKNPISKSVPIIKLKKEYNKTQFSMEHMEINGLLKIDILGLRNLTIIKEIQKEIFNNFGKKLLLNKISIDDDKTNELLSKGDTKGIFQLESYGMKNTLATVGVNSFDDITIIISLFRPGPIEFINVYADRKKGIEPTPVISPEYDKITQKTFGIIVFQEQIMEIAQEFSGMSFSQADILRRAISKKKIKLISSLKNFFFQGAISKGHNKEVIANVYNSIRAFAKYGFNKSHAVAYALITYRMAFLKARFPVEFYTAIINASLDSQKTIHTYILEAKSKNIKVKNPCVNVSRSNVFNYKGLIIMPLRFIKGFGVVAQKKLLDERNANGPYTDFFDFVSRVKLIGLGSHAITLLISSNALRIFGNMQTLLDTLLSAIRYGDMITFTKDDKKKLDFNLIEKPRLIKSKRNIRDEIFSEKKLLGFNYNVFYTDNHTTPEKLKDFKNKKIITVAIYVDNIYKKKDKNNNNYARVIAHDRTDKIEFNIFANTWEFIDNSKPNKVYIATIKKRMFKDKVNYILEKPWKEINE